MAIDPEYVHLLEDAAATSTPAVVRPIAFLFRHGADTGQRVREALQSANQFVAANPAVVPSRYGTVVRLSYAWRGLIEAGVRPDKIVYREGAINRHDPLLAQLAAEGVEIVVVPSMLSDLLKP